MDLRDNFQERKKIHQQGNCDRISELHEPLIIQILSLLDMKDAVKTGVLSKKWKRLWMQVDNIVFHFGEENKLDHEKLQKFIFFVDETLMRCTCPNVKKFSLIICGFTFTDTDCTVDLYKLLDKWLEFVLNKNVITLELGDGLEYRGPSCLYHNSSIERLALDDVSCYHLTDSINWPSLKSLSLKLVYFGGEIMGKILLGCPMLESLVLDEVRGMRHLTITSPSLKILKLLNLQYDEPAFDTNGYYDCILKIQAPWVQELEIAGHFVEIECQLVDVSSLKYANLTFNFSFSNSVVQEDTNIMWRNMVNEILNRVCHVDKIVIGSDLVQAMSLSKMLDGPPPIFKCKHLTIHSPHTLSVYEIPGIVCLYKTCLI